MPNGQHSQQDSLSLLMLGMDEVDILQRLLYETQGKHFDHFPPIRHEQDGTSSTGQINEIQDVLEPGSMRQPWQMQRSPLTMHITTIRIL